MDRLLEKGYIHLYDHLIHMAELPAFDERKAKIQELSFSKISHIILETQKSITDQVTSNIPSDAQNILFLLGKTGAGKSTTFCFLRGDTMEIDFLGFYSSTSGKELIGHGTQSVTFLPTVEITSDLVMVDFLGFSDTHGPLVCLGIECALKRLIGRHNPKILVLQTITDTEARGTSVSEFGSDLERILGKNKESCILGITQYSQYRDFIQIKSIEEQQRRELSQRKQADERELERDIESCKSFRRFIDESRKQEFEQQIQTLENRLDELRRTRGNCPLEDLPDTQEKSEYRHQLKEREDTLMKEIGLKKHIPFFDLENSQKRDHCLRDLLSCNTSIGWPTK